MKRSESDIDVVASAEKNFVDAYGSVSDCMCEEGRKLQMAVSEQRTRPELFTPDRVGIPGAYCATHGRRCK